MTSPRNASPTRALVLGGGGAVGVAWQTGLITGLREAGVELSRADAIVGTSAGALVGALLASGRAVTDALTSLGTLGQRIDPKRMAAGNDAFLGAMRQVNFGTDPRHALREIGLAAQKASTPAEDVYLRLFGVLDGIAWPAGFRCTAIDIDTGELIVWHEGSSVRLIEAVASSCALPLLFPVVTINGRRYMDAGILSRLNATVVPPADVVVVLSCHSLDPCGASVAGAMAASGAKAIAEVAQLRETSRLVVIEADFSDIGATENRMMDPNLAIQAVQIGKRQAQQEAAAIEARWNF